MSITLKEALATLGINDPSDKPLKMKDVQKKYYQLSLIHHPDRPGSDTIMQQKVNEAFEFIGDLLIIMTFVMILRKRLPAMFIRTSTSTISRRIFTPLPSRLTTICQISGMQSSPTTMANPSIGTPMANTGSIIIILMTTQTLGRSQLGNGIFLRRISNRRSTYKAIALVTFYQLTLSPSTSRNFLLKSKPGPL